MKVKDTPEALARGLAVGFFFGVSFFWGLQIALAVLASYLLRGNKVVAAAMTAISNPLVGTTLVGAVGAVVVYFSSNRLLAALRRWHERRSEGRAHADEDQTSARVTSAAEGTRARQ